MILDSKFAVGSPQGVASLLGMLSSAEIYLPSYGEDKILCAKLHPDSKYPCPFLCQYPSHRHSWI